jgi:hypothetical protein
MAYLMTAFELCPDFEIATEELATLIAVLADPVADEAAARERAEGVFRRLSSP